MSATQDRAVDLFVDAGLLAHEQHVLDQALAELGDCLGGLDHTGRCQKCGRLVVRLHNKRGCAMVIPVVGQLLWLWDNAYSVPFFGKALWLVRRRIRPVSSDPSAAGSER